MFDLLIFTASFGSFVGLTCSVRIDYFDSLNSLHIPQISIPYEYNHNNFSNLSSTYDGTYSFNCEGCIYDVIVSQSGTLVFTTEDGQDLETENNLLLST